MRISSSLWNEITLPAGLVELRIYDNSQKVWFRKVFVQKTKEITVKAEKKVQFGKVELTSGNVEGNVLIDNIQWEYIKSNEIRLSLILFYTNSFQNFRVKSFHNYCFH